MPDIFLRQAEAVNYDIKLCDPTNVCSVGYNLNFADTVTISDEVVKSAGIVKSDTVTISDTITKSVGLSKADSVTISDAIL